MYCFIFDWIEQDTQTCVSISTYHFAYLAEKEIDEMCWFPINLRHLGTVWQWEPEYTKWRLWQLCKIPSRYI